MAVGKAMTEDDIRSDERQRCARIALETAASHAAGWKATPSEEGCGGAVAASNTGYHICRALGLTHDEIKAALPDVTPPAINPPGELEFTIAKLTMQPGDVLAVKVPNLQTHEHAKRVDEYVRRCLPDGCEVLIVDKATDLVVIAPPKAEG